MLESAQTSGLWRVPYFFSQSLIRVEIITETMERGGPCWLLIWGELLVRWACRASTRVFYSALTALFGPCSTKYFFPHCTLFKLLCAPIAQQAEEVSVLGRLSLRMRLWKQHHCSKFFILGYTKGSEKTKWSEFALILRDHWRIFPPVLFYTQPIFPSYSLPKGGKGVTMVTKV